MSDPSANTPISWWASGLLRSRGLLEVFNRRPPSLEGAICSRMLIEHFPEDARLTVELADTPDPLPTRWARRGHNALRLYLQISDLSYIHVRGSLTGGPCCIRIASSPRGVTTAIWNDVYEAKIAAQYGYFSQMEVFRRDAPVTL